MKADASLPWEIVQQNNSSRKALASRAGVNDASSAAAAAGLILPQCLWKIHCTMLDAKNFQSHSGKAVENQIIFKIIHAPRTDVLQILAAKFSQPAFERLQRESLNRQVNRLQKTGCGGGVVFQDALEVTVGVQLGVVPDKNFHPVHAARARRPLRVASAAKWPRLYFFSGLRSE